ncbi:MAG TPA: hypothetical protein DCR97_04985 [Deltaproteobacteria bacterium]|nr:hypothetical protein [Deltaproteobacteria bacterium]
MTQDKGDTLSPAEIGDPVPDEHALTATMISSRYGSMVFKKISPSVLLFLCNLRVSFLIQNAR